MDILVKFNPGPKSLRSKALDVTGHLLIKCLNENQLNFNSVSYILGTCEEALKELVSNLPVTLKSELLDKTMGFIQNQFLVKITSRTSFISIMLSSLIEILYDPMIPVLILPNELEWHNESRLKVLHCLYRDKKANIGLKTLIFQCYQSLIYQQIPPPFSEKYILTNVLLHLNNLCNLILMNVCDDDILQVLGTSCLKLENLDIRDSFQVTDDGINRFCRIQPIIKKAIRVGYQPTPLVMANDIKSRANESNIKKINLTGTSITQHSLSILLNNCKELVNLEADDYIWQIFLETFEEDGPGCIECIGNNLKLTDLTPTFNASKCLSLIHNLLPNLEHLNIDRVSNMINVNDYLPQFERLSRITLKEISPIDIEKGIYILGKNIKVMSILSGQTKRPISSLSLVNIDMNHLSHYFPNLDSLELINVTLNGSKINGEIKLPNLKNFKVIFKVVQSCSIWMDIVKSSKQLQVIKCINLVISDQDFGAILKCNQLLQLQELGLFGPGINLTEKSIFQLVKCCPLLIRIGGLCDWKNIQDLIQLLQKLLIEGGWRITLESSYK